jgi:RecG-like helicase
MIQPIGASPYWALLMLGSLLLTLGAQSCGPSQSKKDLANKADYQLTVEELRQEAQQSPEATNNKYRDKAVQITGKVAMKATPYEDETILRLADPKGKYLVECKFFDQRAARAAQHEIGDTVRVLGTCAGINPLARLKDCRFVGAAQE